MGATFGARELELCSGSLALFDVAPRVLVELCLVLCTAEIKGVALELRGHRVLGVDLHPTDGIDRLRGSGRSRSTGGRLAFSAVAVSWSICFTFSLQCSRQLVISSVVKACCSAL